MENFIHSEQISHSNYLEATILANPMDLDKSPKVRNDIIRLLYCVFLKEFSFEEIRAFWQLHPLILGENPLSEEQLFTYIWEDYYCPAEYLLNVLNSFEDFLLKKNIDPAIFIQDNLFSKNNGSIIKGRALFSFIMHHLKKMFESNDFREFFLDLLPKLAEFIVPNSETILIKKTNDNGRLEYVHLHKLDSPKQTSFNAEIWLKPVLTNLPLVINAPLFDSVEILCEQRNMVQILKKHGFYCLQENDFEVTVEGKTCGKVVLLNNCNDSYLHHTSNLPTKCAKIVVATKHVAVNNLSNPIIMKNCQYSFPYIISKVVFSTASTSSDFFMQTCFNGVLDTSKSIKTVFENKHEEFINSLRCKNIFVYNVLECALYLNGQRIIKGLPAKILAILLIRLNSNKNTEILLKTLKSHAWVIDDFIKDASLNSRILWLKKVLEKKIPFLSLTRNSGQGTIGIVSECVVEISIDEC